MNQFTEYEDIEIQVTDEDIAKQEEIQAQRDLERQRIQEAEISQGDKAGPPQPGTEPQQSNVQQKVEQQPENTYDEGLLGDVQRISEDASNNPITGAFAGMGAGVADTAVDILGIFPWFKSFDEWYDEKLGRDRVGGLAQGWRDLSGLVIPTLTGGGLVAKGLQGTAKLMGAAKLAQAGSKANILGKIAVDMGVGTGIEAVADQTQEAGNLGTLIEDTMGVQVPWATRDGMDADTIYQNNMYESAALGGFIGVIDGALTLFRKGKPSTLLKAKDKASETIVEAENIKRSAPAEDRIVNKATKIEDAQTEEAVKRFEADPEGNKGYDSFVNEPHEPQARAVQAADADPVHFKAENAKIINNTGSVNGRQPPAVTPHFKDKFLKAKDGTARGKLLESLTNDLDTSFDVMIGPNRIPAKQVDEAVDALVSIAFNEPENFAKEVDNMRQATDSIFGNSTKNLTEDAFAVAAESYKKLFDIIDPKKQRASAVVTTQAAGEVTDAARAVELLGDTVDTTRQQELAWNALRILGPEIRANQKISGIKLNLKNLIKERQAKGLNIDAKWFDEKGKEFELSLKNAKEESYAFIDEAVEISRKNPEYFKPLMKEYVKSNGQIDTLNKLTKRMESRISFWKKAFYDGEPEVPSMLVNELQGLRYNNILTGLAPVRAAAGAFTGLVGKPTSMLVGSAARGDMASLKRSLFVFGGIQENLMRAFTNLADEYKYALENPRKSMARGRKDFDFGSMAEIDQMDEMAEAWRKNGESGKVAVWNMTKALSYFNDNPVVRFGLNSMTAIDGFVRSMSASMTARAQAYDELFDAAKGSINNDAFDALQKKLYNGSFDVNGQMTDSAAGIIAGEINLNMDTKVTSALEGVMRTVPVAKAIFMFPRTGVNALNLAMTFDPTGVLSKSITKAGRVMKAVNRADIDAALVEHGYKAGDDAAFEALKSEYKGRQIMGAAVTMGAAMWAMNGNLTGSGPQDDAERRRMIAMGWEPFSFKDPISGEWRSYQGLEPFDTYLGLVGDIVYQGQRLDQSITEDFLRAAAHSVSMNITNKSFLSGFEPLARLISGDPSAFSRFFAMQADSYIPGTGVRSILNKAITPQLKDVEFTFLSYLANRSKFLGPVNESLFDMVDVYTGEPINYTDGFTAAINSVLPFFKTNGGMEPWRQKLIASGWDNLQAVRTNKITGEPLTPRERNWINNWIGKNYRLGSRVEELLNQSDSWWDTKMKKYARARGLKTQAEFPIKETVMYQLLDDLHNDAFTKAFGALRESDINYAYKGTLTESVKQNIRGGDFKAAEQQAQQAQGMNQ